MSSKSPERFESSKNSTGDHHMASVAADIWSGPVSNFAQRSQKSEIHLAGLAPPNQCNAELKPIPPDQFNAENNLPVNTDSRYRNEPNIDKGDGRATPVDPRITDHPGRYVNPEWKKTPCIGEPLTG